MATKDPNGYYAILEIAATASASDIKTAYRRCAMELHPDRNKSPFATRDFQLLVEAYAVLNDPSARARYDTSTIETTQRQCEPTAEIPTPIECSMCAKVTAQPRYAIFYEVKSFVVLTRRTAIQGVLCSGCAEKRALHATVITWVLGWWGLPWGFIYSIHAIISNLSGGERPVTINARLAVHQAWVFASLGKLETARAIATDAQALVRRIKPDKELLRKKKRGYAIPDERAQLTKVIDTILTVTNAGGSATKLKNSWALLRRPFFIQAAILLIVVAVLAIAVQAGTRTLRHTHKPTSQTVTPRKHPGRHTKRPPTAHNGARWQKFPNYIPEYPVYATTGIQQSRSTTPGIDKPTEFPETSSKRNSEMHGRQLVSYRPARHSRREIVSLTALESPHAFLVAAIHASICDRHGGACTEKT
jgi:hypothetical protein